MAELRAGHLPLWNPYLFAGVPFLANPQAAVLYPLHWPLIWMEPSQALIWSALLHVWLAAGFMYTFARRSAGLSSLASWLAGALFGLGGFTLAKIENINQLNGLAWLPAMLWLFDETRRAAGWRRRVRWGVALAIVIALQLLAGHTQTAFINLVGLGVYAVWPVGKLVYWYIGRMVERRRSGLSDTAASPSALPVSHSPILPLSRRPPPAASPSSGVRSRRRPTAAIAGAECAGAASRRAALPAGRQLLTAAEIACADPAASGGRRPRRSIRQRGLRRVRRLHRRHGADPGGDRRPQPGSEEIGQSQP